MNANASLIPKLVALAIVACVPLSGESFYIEIVGKVLVMAIFAMSLDLLVGFTGLVSFGHAAYFGIAAYAVAILSPEYEAASLWYVLPASVGLSALAAFVIGLFVLRTKGIYFIMVTLAFAQMAYFIFHDTPLGGGSDGKYLNNKPSASIFGWEPFDLTNEVHMFYFVLVVLVLVYLFLARVLQSPFGRVLVGIKSNEHRMQSLGYLTFRYKLGAFTLAGALGGLAGVLY
ncbi:MAG: branched-chain amino acid ABC transporter permease, partial [Thauera sp.]